MYTNSSTTNTSNIVTVVRRVSSLSDYECVSDCSLVDECDKNAEVMPLHMQSSFEYSTFDLDGGDNSSYTYINRLTKGDFSLIPDSALTVDEDRCEIDGQYRRAMDYLERFGSMNRGMFDTCKKYRDAVNLLVGADVPIHEQFVDGGLVKKEQWTRETRSPPISAGGLEVEDACGALFAELSSSTFLMESETAAVERIFRELNTSSFFAEVPELEGMLCYCELDQESSTVQLLFDRPDEEISPKVLYPC